MQTDMAYFKQIKDLDAQLVVKVSVRWVGHIIDEY